MKIDRRRKASGFCCYCKRRLSPSTSADDTAFTFDHINPRAAGGGRKVPCCRKCNELKDQLAPADWFWIIDNIARWWKVFARASQVRTAIQDERVRRAKAGEPQIGTEV